MAVSVLRIMAPPEFPESQPTRRVANGGQLRKRFRFSTRCPNPLTACNDVAAVNCRYVASGAANDAVAAPVLGVDAVVARAPREAGGAPAPRGPGAARPPLDAGGPAAPRQPIGRGPP